MILLAEMNSALLSLGSGCAADAQRLLPSCYNAVCARSSRPLRYCVGSANCLEAAFDFAAAVPLRTMMTVM